MDRRCGWEAAGLTPENFKELLQLPDTLVDISNIPQAQTVQAALSIIVKRSKSMLAWNLSRFQLCISICALGVQ